MSQQAITIWNPGALSRQSGQSDNRDAAASSERHTYRIENLPVNWGVTVEFAIQMFLGKIGVQNIFFRIIKFVEVPSRGSWQSHRFDVDISIGADLKKSLDSPAFRLALLLLNEEKSLTNASEYITVSPVLTPRESAIRNVLEGVCGLLNSKRAFERFSVDGETIVFHSFHQLKKILAIDDVYQCHREEYMEIITNCSEEVYSEMKAWLEEGVPPNLRNRVESEKEPEPIGEPEQAPDIEQIKELEQEKETELQIKIEDDQEIDQPELELVLEKVPESQPNIESELVTDKVLERGPVPQPYAEAELYRRLNVESEPIKKKNKHVKHKSFGTFLYRYKVENFVTDGLSEDIVSRLFSQLGFPGRIKFRIVSFLKISNKKFNLNLDFKKSGHQFLRSPKFQNMVSSFNEGKSERLKVSAILSTRDVAILEVLEGVCALLNKGKDRTKYNAVVNNLRIQVNQQNKACIVMDIFHIFSRFRNEYLHALKRTANVVREEMRKLFKENEVPGEEDPVMVDRKNSSLVMKGICEILNSKNPEYPYSVKKQKIRVKCADDTWKRFTFQQTILSFPNEYKQFVENFEPVTREELKKWAESRKRKLNDEGQGPPPKKFTL